MKIVERVLERRLRTLIHLNKMRFGFTPGKKTENAIIIMRRLEEEYKNKPYMCFVETKGDRVGLEKEVMV